MADTKDTSKDNSKTIESVCSLSVPTIITALHQNAIAHCNAASKNVRLLNSAISDDDSGELKSAGEHLISVVPLKSGENVEKTVAIEVIKSYVQWFVGPDLANKVSDSTVIPLSQAPGADKNVADKQESLNNMFNLSFKDFMLLENNNSEDDELSGEGDDSDDETGEGDDEDDETGEGDDSDDETGEGDDEDDETGDGDDKDDNTGEGNEEGDETGEGSVDETKESPIGYYIAYNLKVEGLKSTALKDAMKKFAATLFDDLTIKADGLFGGGQSFTVGDVKKTIKDLFGGVDPNALITNLSKTLQKKYSGCTVDIELKDNIFKEYKGDLDVKQKAAIDKANSSLVIDVPATHSKEMNTRILADMVTLSIKGLFKKFKHQIKKDDIIVIHKSAGSLSNKQKQNNENKLELPPPKRFEASIVIFKNLADAYEQMNTLMSNVKKSDKYKNSSFATSVYDLWDSWVSTHTKSSNNTKDLGDNSVEELKNHFSTLIKDYSKLYDDEMKSRKNDEKKLNETDDLIMNIISESVRRRFYSNIDRNRNNVTLKNEIMNILMDSETLSEDEEREINASDDNDADIEDMLGGNEDAESSTDSASADTSKEDDKKEPNKNSPTDDVYIIPMPGLADSDDE